MLYNLLESLIGYVPDILDFLSNFQGGLLGECLILAFFAIIIDPLSDLIVKICSAFTKCMKFFEK